MITREIGQSGVRVGEIGLGTEHLVNASKASVKSIVDTAVQNGINYFDVVFNLDNCLTNFGEAFKPHRDQLVLTAHLGSAEKNGQYFKTRNINECEKTFQHTLRKLCTDHVDIANVHYVKDLKEYNEVTAPNSVLDLAHQLKKQGKTRLVSISTHDVRVVKKAAESGSFDAITFPVSIANNALPNRNEALSTCAKHGVGVVAMKVFAGGTLLRLNSTVKITAIRKGGGKTVEFFIPQEMTATRCLSYALSQIAVSTVIPGASNLQELNDTLTYVKATQDEKDFSKIIEGFKEYTTGQCVYCNHCLPCPKNIDIGQVTNLFDTAKHHLTQQTKNEYGKIKNKASKCNNCGACNARCPFGVDPVANMKKATELFEKPKTKSGLL